jgi:hypothetical protein
MKLSGINISTTEPNPDLLWAKPMPGGGFAFYLFNNGRWQPMKIVNDMGTSSVADDVVATIGSGTIDNLDDIVRDEVTRQVSEHDDNIRDTHNADTGDDGEYADVEGLFN